MSDLEKGDETGRPATLLEKIATAISALLIVGLLIVLIVDAVQHNAEASFATSIGALQELSGAVRVPITVRNLGDDAARSVVVHAELLAADSILGETDVTVDWLPGKSSRDVVALFSPARPTPRSMNVRAEVRGFAIP